MVNDSPCHGCTAETGRTPTCHNAGECERHDKWKAQHEKEREETRQRKQKQNMLRWYHVDLANRLRKGDHGR